MGSEKDLNTAAEFIRKGGVIIIPTDTIYGFSCAPGCEGAVNRIFEFKKRENKPFIILDSSLERIRNSYYRQSVLLKRVMSVMIDEKMWPGKITLIADRKEETGYKFLKDQKKIAVRFTEFTAVKYICDQIGSGIVSTSINISGEKHINDLRQLKSEWDGIVDYILERETEGGVASAIIEILEEEAAVRLIRAEDEEQKDKIIEVFAKRGIKCL
ncbi:MAG TPA: L-threonylcarbamoyladenylate synthase [Clostridiales bacterium]|jgi:L-threonylcarbamoyladenylate synthase|nr:L-threonylcarbamoyladenylate synthase [Clostridiales bacterium]HQP70918.1 L-threonylcarbamoyladenylate synthase [Clostridiales bacterium]